MHHYSLFHGLIFFKKKRAFLRDQVEKRAKHWHESGVESNGRPFETIIGQQYNLFRLFSKDSRINKFRRDQRVTSWWKSSVFKYRGNIIIKIIYWVNKLMNKMQIFLQIQYNKIENSLQQIN